MAALRQNILLLRRRLAWSCGISALKEQSGEFSTFTSTLAGASQPSGQYQHQDSFDFIAGSMRKCLKHLGPWSIGDLAFGLKALADSHAELTDDIQGVPLRDVATLQEYLEEVRIADAIYEADKARVARACCLEEQNVIKFLPTADRLRPAYCIALRPKHKQVLLVVRGTKSIGDAITIMAGSGADFQGGHTHAGMLHSAHWLLNHETGTLRRLLEENPGFRLHFIGHSLGAGAASLYAMILRERQSNGHHDLPPGTLPTCLAVATPACTTQEIAAGCSDYITTLVCQNDIVPRACLWGFEQLRLEVVRCNWQEEYTEKFVAEEVLDFARDASELVAAQYSKVSQLLMSRDAPTGKAVKILADAWQSLAADTSKHSRAAKDLLRVTSLRISKLPANSAMRSPQNAESEGNPEADDSDDFDRLQPSEGSQEAEQQPRHSDWQLPIKFQEMQARLRGLWGRAPGGDGSGATATSKLASGSSRNVERAHSGGHGEQEGMQSKMQHSDAQTQNPEAQPTTGGVSLAADDWWESSFHISGTAAGKHRIEPPSDGTIADLGKSQSVTRRKMFKRIGTDMDRIVTSYGLGDDGSKAQRNAAKEEPKEVIGLASDGEVEMEIAKLTAEIDEEEKKKKETAFVLAPRMHAPGKLVFLQRYKGGDGSVRFRAIQGHAGQSFGRIILRKSMIVDHLCTTYIEALKSAMKA